MPTSVNSRLKVFSDFRGSNGSRSCHRLVGHVEQGADLRRHLDGARGRLHAAATPHEQRIVEAQPQARQQLADRRLRGLEAHGGARDAALADQRIEHAQIAKVDPGRFHFRHMKHSLSAMDIESPLCYPAVNERPNGHADPEDAMTKFVIESHFRLQEWVAEEKGYFRAEGLDYEFRELIRSTDGPAPQQGQ